MAQQTKLKRRDLYYFDLVVFQVADTLFKVPKNHFSTSNLFATIFTLPPGEHGVEGTEDKPFVLHGISEVDFESLLKLMYPSPLTTVKLTRQEWISVLKLCTMWEFTDIRERAIQELSKKEIRMETMEKIECGKTCEVKEWILDGYVELLKREETLTDQEAERLGWKTAAKLLLMREQYLSYTISSQFSQACEGCGHRKGDFYRHRHRASYDYYDGYGQQIKNLGRQTTTLPDRSQHDFRTAVRKELETEL